LKTTDEKNEQAAQQFKEKQALVEKYLNLLSGKE